MVVYRDDQLITINVSPVIMATYHGRIDVINFFILQDKAFRKDIRAQFIAAIYARQDKTARILAD